MRLPADCTGESGPPEEDHPGPEGECEAAVRLPADRTEELAPLEKQIFAVILEHRLVEPGDLVLVGVSGGADSVCLLSVLLSLREKLGCTLAAVHVHHGMRAAADGEADFVRQLVRERGIPFYLEKLDVPSLCRSWRCSPEEGARRARFMAFARVLEETGAKRLALAHNRDDQAETVLLKLFRGAGLRGFAGIAPLSCYRGGQELADPRSDEPDRFSFPVIRPLLFTPRSDIERYLLGQGLAHVEDDSNGRDDYARNRIRRHVLPYVRDNINERSAQHLADAALRAQEVLAYLDREARERYAETVIRRDSRGLTLDAARLRRYPAFLREELLFYALRDLNACDGVGEAHIGALLRLISTGEGTKRVMLPGGWCGVRVYNELTLAREDSEERECRHPGRLIKRVINREAGTPVEEIPTDPYTKWFDCDKIQEPVTLRTRLPGDWIDTGAGRRALKKELIDRKLPAAERDRLPLAAAGSEILWIVGVRRCEAYRVTADTTRILELKYTESGPT